MTEFLICADPGLTTGLALLEIPNDTPAKLVTYNEVAGAPEPLYAVLGVWLSAFCKGSKVTVVMEDWDSLKQDSVPDARYACYPAGMVLMFAYERGVDVVLQRRQERLSIPDTKKVLGPLGYWIPGSKGGSGWRGDARQAMRHGLAYAKSELHHQPTIEYLFPRTV